MTKKIALIFVGNGAGTTLFTPTTPATGPFQNKNVNPAGSNYAAQYGHGVSSQVQKVVRSIIYDAAPAQYFDLKIMGLKGSKMVNSDEYFYHEIGFGRDPIIIGAVNAEIPSGTTQTLPCSNPGSVTVDTIVVYPNNSRGTVTSIDAGAGTIVVTAETGNVLPAVPVGVEGATTLSNLSPVEADGATSISQYFRIDTVERCNYIQQVVKAQRWGKMEYEKYKRAGTLSNFLQMQRKRMYDQFRIDLANIYWNGRMAEVTLANGQKAKTAGGIFPIMQQVGSANATASLANLPTALEELALDTEYGVYGKTRFLYAAPRVIHYLSQEYKRELTRYAPNDMLAKLGLKGVDMGSTNIVFVPIKRFEEPSCFPSSWRSRMILIDQESIQPVHFFPEEAGETLARVNNGTLNNYHDSWISATHGIEFYNPLGCGWIDISDLP